MNRPHITTRILCMQSKCCNVVAVYMYVCVVVNSTCDLDVCSCSHMCVCTVHFGCICNQSMVNINKRRKLKRTETKRKKNSTESLENYGNGNKIEFVLNSMTFVPISTQYWVSFRFFFLSLCSNLSARFIFNIILFNVLFTRDHSFWCFSCFLLLLLLIRFDSSIYGFILFGRVRVGLEDSGDDDDDGGDCGGGGDSDSRKPTTR